jgi:peptide/nickel transport system ATP-binding protein
MKLLEVNNLSIEYQSRKGPITATDNVSFALERGKTLGFVGESGCGKSTLGMAIMGLLPKHASVINGSILFENKNILDITSKEMRQIRWTKISMIFQAAMNALNPVHRVADQIAEAITTHTAGLSDESVTKQVEELFDLVSLPKSRMKEYPHQYSGGMKQRAVIAMALACQPDLIIADEPTTALDVILQDQILDTLKILQEKLNLAILFISHDIAVVADVCHDIGVMYAGQLIEYGDRKKVFASPAHPYTKILTASYFALMGDKGAPDATPGTSYNKVHPHNGCYFSDRCTLKGDNCRNQSPAWVEISPNHRVFCSRYKGTNR